MITPLSTHGSHDEAVNNVWTQVIFPHYFQDKAIVEDTGFFLFNITPHIITLWGIAAVMLIVFILIAQKYKKGILKKPSRFMILIEMIVVFVRDDILKPFLGDKTIQFLPYFMTLFLFILFANLWGNVPIPVLQKVATANFAVTTMLMLVTFFMVNIWGLYKNKGVLGYLKTFAPPGVNIFITAFVWFFEFLSLFIRHIALTIRLFANMVGGHITVFAILYLIIQFKTFWISIAAVPFAVVITLLELFVALLQAYIFTLLSAAFMGMASEEH